MSADLSKLLNAIGLLAISTVLTLALIDQIWFADLPCPLCILQRAGLIAAGVGISLKTEPLRHGDHRSLFSLRHLDVADLHAHYSGGRPLRKRSFSASIFTLGHSSLPQQSLPDVVDFIVKCNGLKQI